MGGTDEVWKGRELFRVQETRRKHSKPQIGPHATPRPPHDNLSFEEKMTARDYWLVKLIRFNVVSNSAIQVVDF
jgi:hypothetical protein